MSNIYGGCAYPAYFAVVNGSSHYPLWILPGSQKYVFFNSEELKMVSKRERLRLIYVPPYSIVIVRGDVLHCGAGSFEHLYIGREGIGLPDAIDEVSHFNICEEDKLEDWKKLIVRY